MNMSFPPPPSEVHFIHNHPSDQTEPNPLGRIKHSWMLDNLSGILCCKSTSTLRTWTCYSLLVLERWIILYLNSSVPSSSSSVYHGKKVLSSVFFFPFREPHLLFCYSWCFPILSWNGQEIIQEKMASTQAMKYEERTLLPLLQLPLHEKTLQH